MFKLHTTEGKFFIQSHGQSILDAGLLAGVPLPYSCKTGRCSSCKCKIVSGESTATHAETGLSVEEKEQGWILSCVRSASSDLLLEIDDLGNFTLPSVKTLPCRINALIALTRDVVKVEVRLPPTSDFRFLPGQYVEIIGANGVRRSYSIAKANAEDKILEFHIRAVEDGIMSSYWFGSAKVNDLLRLNGPLGTFFLRDTKNVDLIFLATGTGIAPVKAILESLSSFPKELMPRSVSVYWGGRFLSELYLDVHALSVVDKYVPVLSRQTESWFGVRGYVQQAVLADKPDLPNAMVYACGSDNMIHSAKKVLVEAGLPGRHFFSDAFVCSAVI